jgi:hypothetical protein
MLRRNPVYIPSHLGGSWVKEKDSATPSPDTFDRRPTAA